MSGRSKSALLLGATGLIGGHCLKLLLENSAYGQVTVLARRPAVIKHDRLDWQVIDFERLE
ncbi:MAG: oxidoreductase, partial [Candidatus Marinimicrobia bacterium]|nr:oxidoreductase [Candidatus Neomarinimicrobiota bacterium]